MHDDERQVHGVLTEQMFGRCERRGGLLVDSPETRDMMTTRGAAPFGLPQSLLRTKTMNRTAKVCLGAGAGLIALVLAASLLPVSRLRAQDGGEPSRRGRDSVEPSPVHAEEETDADSAALQVAGAALRPENSADVEWAVPKVGTAGCIYAESGDPKGFWNAPIYPPQGATLTKLGVYVHDFSNTADAYGGIGVVDAYGNVLHEWYSFSSGSSGNTYFEIAIPDHQVDYAAYSYLLWWRPNLLGANMKLCGFRLYYTPPGWIVYLPETMNNY